MIEVKEINRIQKEYLDLLTCNLELISNQETNYKQLAYFFEEVSLFWRKKLGTINFFLNKIEVEDKCSFLAGAMYIDLANYGHYEFAPCGKYHIFTDPVTKMRAFFTRGAKGVKTTRIKEYLKKVVIDCIEVLTNYTDLFIVLPLDDILVEDQEKRYKFLMESSFSLISSLFKDTFTEEEFKKRYKTIEEIEKDIKPGLVDKLIFNDRSDQRSSLRERIEANLNDVLEYDALKKRLNEAEIFIMAVGQFFMQAMDIILISYSYKLIPFIRSDVVFNYLFMLYPIFEEEKIMVDLLEQTVIAYLFTKMYGTEEFSKTDFGEFNNYVNNNKMIDNVVKTSRVMGENIFKLEVNQVASIINEVYSKLSRCNDDLKYILFD